MDKFQSKLEGILMPIGSKIANNKYLKVLQKSFIAVMPLTIAGSIALIISYFPFIDYVAVSYTHLDVYKRQVWELVLY